MGCPFTKGSGGSWNSRGVISAWLLLREDVVREARVFALARKSGVPGDDDGSGDVGEDTGNELFIGEMGPEVSD